MSKKRTLLVEDCFFPGKTEAKLTVSYDNQIRIKVCDQLPPLVRGEVIRVLTEVGLVVRNWPRDKTLRASFTRVDNIAERERFTLLSKPRADKVREKLTVFLPRPNFMERCCRPSRLDAADASSDMLFLKALISATFSPAGAPPNTSCSGRGATVCWPERPMLLLCQDCKSAEGFHTICPFDSELYDKETPLVLCAECSEERYWEVLSAPNRNSPTQKLMHTLKSHAYRARARLFDLL